VWREEHIRELLAEDDADLLFVSGCATNQVKFYEHFDHVILLSAPADVLLERLSSRTTNSYGKSPKERADVLRYLQTVEPLLRRTAGHEIVTTVSVAEVVAILLQLVSA
jgi:shikimate kinase